MAKVKSIPVEQEVSTENVPVMDLQVVEKGKKSSSKQDPKDLVNFSFNSWLTLSEGDILTSVNSILSGIGRCDQATFALRHYDVISRKDCVALANGSMSVDEFKRNALQQLVASVMSNDIPPMRISHRSVGYENNFRWYNVCSFTYDMKDILRNNPSMFDMLRETLAWVCDVKTNEIKSGKCKNKKEEVLTKDNPLYNRLLAKLTSLKKIFKDPKTMWVEAEQASRSLSYLAPGFTAREWDSIKL